MTVNLDFAVGGNVAGEILQSSYNASFASIFIIIIIHPYAPHAMAFSRSTKNVKGYMHPKKTRQTRKDGLPFPCSMCTMCIVLYRVLLS